MIQESTNYKYNPQKEKGTIFLEGACIKLGQKIQPLIHDEINPHIFIFLSKNEKKK